MIMLLFASESKYCSPHFELPAFGVVDKFLPFPLFQSDSGYDAFFFAGAFPKIIQGFNLIVVMIMKLFPPDQNGSFLWGKKRENVNVPPQTCANARIYGQK